MQFNAIGDLAAHLAIRGHTARLTGNVERLTEEVASGRRADLSAALGGNFRPLAAIDRDLTLLDRYDTATTEAALRLDAEQAALGTVQDRVEDTLSVLLTFSGAPGAPELDAAEAAAANGFRDAVGALNSGVAGEALFAGIATDGAALLDAESLLAELATAVAAETSAQAVHDVVAAWFGDADGGFETAGYLGDPVARAPVAIGENVSVAGGPTALDPALRAVLAPLATLALAEIGAPGLDTAGRAELAELARADLLNANGGLIALRAATGARQERVEEQETANAAERGVLEIARSVLTDADPYDSAIELEAATNQLEILYTITGRLSRLSLVNYLR